MTKREFSSSLQGMKFMQRGRLRDEAIKKEEQEDETQWLAPASQTSSRCVVIMEGDPKPGAVVGRMSFKNFNPTIDKLQEELETRKSQVKSKAADISSQHQQQQKQHEKVPHDNKGKSESSTSSRADEEEEEPLKKKVKAEASASLNNPQNRFSAIQGKQGFRKPPKF